MESLGKSVSPLLTKIRVLIHDELYRIVHHLIILYMFEFYDR